MTGVQTCALPIFIGAAVLSAIIGKYLEAGAIGLIVVNVMGEFRIGCSPRRTTTTCFATRGLDSPI